MRNRGRRGRVILQDQSGSILPLILGYVTIALALIVVTVGATSVYLVQKNIDAIASAAALAGADGFELTATDQGAAAHLTNEAVWLQANEVVSASTPDVALDYAVTDDGVTARVRVSTVWHPPLVSPLIPAGLTLTATSNSRTALDDD